MNFVCLSCFLFPRCYEFCSHGETRAAKKRVSEWATETKKEARTRAEFEYSKHILIRAISCTSFHCVFVLFCWCCSFVCLLCVETPRLSAEKERKEQTTGKKEEGPIEMATQIPQRTVCVGLVACVSVCVVFVFVCLFACFCLLPVSL